MIHTSGRTSRLQVGRLARLYLARLICHKAPRSALQHILAFVGGACERFQERRAGVRHVGSLKVSEEESCWFWICVAACCRDDVPGHV